MKQLNILLISVVGSVAMTLTACIGGVSPEPAEDVAEPAAVVAPEVQSDSTHLAANPELMAAGRNTAPTVGNEPLSGSAFFAANPEVMTAQRSAPTETMTDSEYYANNPELMAAQRFSADAE
ncbi:MAG TPA: hypothetical protein P5526_22205 [Anaerolineae bacterium]|nr:hypothetical protein [Anaerolineae bacterium]